MSRKYQGSVPRPVDVVELARAMRGRSLREWHDTGPTKYPLAGVSFATVASRTHLRHELLKRMDRVGEDGIPAEIILMVFRCLGLSLKVELGQADPGPFLSFEEMNKLIEEQFGDFPASRLRRTAFEAFKQVMVFDLRAANPTELIDGLDASSIRNHFGDQLSNIVNLRIPIDLAYLAGDVGQRYDHRGTLQDLLDIPRSDVEQAGVLLSRMKSLRRVILDIFEYADTTSPHDNPYMFENTYDSAKELVEDDFAPLLRGLLSGMNVLAQYRVEVLLQVTWYEWCHDGAECQKLVLSSARLAKDSQAEKVCTALIKPLRDGVQHTKDRVSYEISEEGRCMSD